MTSSNENNDWIASSSSRKKRKGRQHTTREPLKSRIFRIQENLDVDWLNECHRILEIPLKAHTALPGVLCLGLGSPDSSDNARVQFAFLLELCKTFLIDHSKVSLYDPVFSDEDKALFKDLGMCVQEDDELNSLVLSSPTILFMPHCDLPLYESVFRTNWTREHLTNLLFICNHFNDYVQSTPLRKLEATAPHVAKAALKVNATPIPSCADWLGAFNNTSVQFIKEDDIQDPWFSMQEQSLTSQGT